MKGNTIHVVFAPDNNYVDYCCISIRSIARSYKGEEYVNIYILSIDLSDANKLKIQQSVDWDNRFCVNIVEIEDDTIIKEFQIKDHFTTAMYSRILIPNVLNQQLDKVVYLDCDILVRKDIKELWDINLDNFALGAVPTFDFNNCDKLGISSQFGYFNSGVLIFDLNKWRTENYVFRTLKYLMENSSSLDLPDQDALNYVLHSDWKEIPVKWNVRTTLFNSEKGKSELQKELIDPAIVHYTTYSKPWHYFNTHPFKKEYLELLIELNYKLEIPKKLKELKTKNIIIFGAGSSGMQTKDIFESKKITVNYFSDNDSSKFNKKICGIEVIEPIKLKEKKEDNVVVISSWFENEIKNQLLSYGLIENTHFFCLESFLSMKYDKAHD